MILDLSVGDLDDCVVGCLERAMALMECRHYPGFLSLASKDGELFLCFLRICVLNG